MSGNSEELGAALAEKDTETSSNTASNQGGAAGLSTDAGDEPPDGDPTEEAPQIRVDRDRENQQLAHLSDEFNGPVNATIHESQAKWTRAMGSNLDKGRYCLPIILIEGAENVEDLSVPEIADYVERINEADKPLVPAGI